MKASEEARKLFPYLMPSIEKMVRGLVAGGGSSGMPGVGGAPSPHALSSVHHTGTLANSQAPQFLLMDGTRDLTGNLAVDPGITIDGVDLSAHAADPDAHHDRATVGDGLEITGQHIAVDLAVNSKLKFTSGDLAVDQGADFLWTGIHQFDQDIQLNANLSFIGGDRAIVASDDLYIDVGGDLILDDADTFRSSDYLDGIPIAGFSMHINSAGDRQMTINTIKADELHVRLFVADTVRVDVGEEYWGKSMGIVHTDFTTPASIGGTVAIKVEDSPAFSGALFSNNDWVLIRIIDDSAGLVVASIWGQVSGYSDLGDDADGRGHQQWTFTLRQGPTNQEVKAGNVMVDFGASGQGYVHLSTLDSADGPWIQIGEWNGANPYTPGNRSIKAQLGNLSNISDTVTNPTGFGLYSENAYLKGIVSAANDVIRLDEDGIRIKGQPAAYDELYSYEFQNTAGQELGGLYLRYTDSTTDLAEIDLLAVGTAGIRPKIGIQAFSDQAGVPGSPFIDIRAVNSDTSVQASITMDVTPTVGTIVIGASDFVSVTAQLKTVEHLPAADDTYNLGSASFRWATVYADQLIITGSISGGILSGAEWEYAGSMVIDANSAGNTVVSIANQGAGRADLDVDRNITLGGTIDGVDLAAHVLNANAHHDAASAGSGISLSGQIVSVDGTVVRTSRSIVAGDGMTGGGDLSADRTLAVNSTVVRTSRTLTAGSGLTGGGDLSANRSFAISLAATSGLNLTSGLAIDDSIAGAGLAISSKVLAVGAGTGILANANDVAVNLAHNFVWTSTHTFNGGNVDISTGDLTVGANILFVDNSLASVGINRAPDAQFALDVNGPIRGTEIVGRHAIQLEDVALLLHFDGGEPYESNYTGEPNGVPFGQVPTTDQNVHYRHGKFYKAAVFSSTRTNLATNPSFETNTTGWSIFNGGGADLAVTRDTTIGHFGTCSAKLTWTTINNSQFYHEPVASASAATYSFGVWLKAAAPATVSLMISRGTSPFTIYRLASVDVTEDWQYFTISTTTTPTAATPLRVTVLPSGSANTLWVDGVQLEQAGYSSWYADGSLGSGYSWSGTAHGSTSSATNSRLVYSLTNMVNHRWTAMGWFCWPFSSSSGTNENAFEIALSGGHYVRFYGIGTTLAAAVNHGGGTNFPTLETSAFAAGVWKHVAVAYTPGSLKFYVNGSLATSVSYTLAGVPTSITCGAVTGPIYGNVMIDDVVISRQALTANRVRAIYESNAPVFAESSVFSFRATPKGLVWADEEGLWMRNAAGDEVLGAYGGESTKSWGGLTLAPSDIIFGDAGRGAYWLWDDSAGSMTIGRVGANRSSAQLDGNSIGIYHNTTRRIFLGGATGTLEINDSGGNAVFTFNSSLGAEFTKPLTLGSAGGIYQGTGTFGSPTTGLKIWRDSDIGRIGGYNSGTLQWYANTDGKLYAGGGVVTLDAQGVSLTAPTNPSLVLGGQNSVDWRISGNRIGGIGASYVSSFNTNYLSLDSLSEVTGRPASIILSAQNYLGGAASLEIWGSATQQLITATGDFSATSIESGTMRSTNDPGGVASKMTLTNVNNGAANSTGVGTIKMKGGTSRDSVGFLKAYIGTTAVWIPYWTTITG